MKNCPKCNENQLIKVFLKSEKDQAMLCEYCGSIFTVNKKGVDLKFYKGSKDVDYIFSDLEKQEDLKTPSWNDDGGNYV